jgi:plastocyanin
MRRIVLATTLVAALAVPVAAQADERVIAGPLSSGFLNPNVSIDQGEKLTFLNPDVAPHDVTSVETGLFSSETVTAGTETPVNGADSLSAGTYDFICSVHPHMTGTLTVGGGGSGGGGHAGHDMKAPKLSVKALDSKASDVLKAGALSLQAKLDEAATVTAVATDAKHGMTIATGSAKLDAGTGRLTARLTGAGKRMLRNSKTISLDLALTATDAAGNAGKKTATAKLR